MINIDKIKNLSKNQLIIFYCIIDDEEGKTARELSVLTKSDIGFINKNLKLMLKENLIKETEERPKRFFV